MRNLRFFNPIHRQAPWPHLLILVLCAIMFSCQPVQAGEQAVWMEREMAQDYIYSLDLTVVENDLGDIKIVKIGYYSPFRRYSWFRVGDVIEEVNGERTTLYSLSSLSKHETPWIKYRRGPEVSEKQIGLETSVFGPSDFVDPTQ